MQAQELGRIVPLNVIRIPFELAEDELAWELPSEFPMASIDEIEGDLALGHPAWGSLVRLSD